MTIFSSVSMRCLPNLYMFLSMCLHFPSLFFCYFSITWPYIYCFQLWVLLKCGPHKDFFFLFNFLAQSYRDPRESKQSFYQSITGSGGMYLCAFKIESFIVIKPFLQSTFILVKSDLFKGSFLQLTDIFYFFFQMWSIPDKFFSLSANVLFCFIASG